ncbi:MAG: glycosyltransferase family 4 protein [Oligoflexus sp.]
MINILYVVSTLQRSGPTLQLLNLLRYLDKSTFNPIVLTLSKEPPDSLISELHQHCENFHSLNLRRVDSLMFGSSKLKKYLEMSHIDIIHTQGIRSDLLASNVSDKYPHIATFRNYPYEDYPSKFGILKGSLMAKKHIKLLKKAKHPIACSNALGKRLLEFNKNTKVIQNGVFFDSSLINPENDSSSHKQDNKRKVFISVGSLIPRKNNKLLIEAFSQRTDLDLIILGGGSEEKDLKSSAYGKENIKIVGHVKNVRSWLNKADVFISASQAEGLPNSVLEALSHRVPCVLSDIDPHKEISETLSFSSGVWLFQNNSIESLLNTIQNAENCSKLSDDQMNVVYNCFEASSMSKKYQQMYQEIINSERKHVDQ